MIARAFLIILIVVSGAGAGAARVVGGAQADGLIMLGWGVGAILAVVAFVVALTYGVARVHASRPPADLRAGPGALGAAVLREFLAHIAAFVILAPFARLWMRGRAEPESMSPPGSTVVLVHGYLLNGAAWRWFARRLEKHGFRPFSATIEPVLGSIDEMGESLARRIEEVCVATGASSVHLVAHSMGGLVCRAYLRAHGAARIGCLVTIASPHHGTEIARLGIGRCAREMTPGAAWLTALAESEIRSKPPPAIALFSYYDNYIAPQESSMLPWARSVPLRTLGHVEMYFSRRVAEQVCDALKARAD